MRILYTLFFLFAFAANSQNAPGFKINNNPYSNINTESLKVVVKKDTRYSTPNWKALTEINREIELLEAKKLQINSNISFTNDSDLTDAEIDIEYEKIEKIQNLIDEKSKRSEKLYRLYMQEYVQIKKFFWLEGKPRSRGIFDVVYGNSEGKLTTLSKTGFNLGDQTGTIYSELVSDQIWVFRVSLGASLTANNSTNEDAKQQEAFQRLLTQGGNTTLKMEYPLFYAHSNDNRFNLLSRFIARGSADFEQFGSDTDDWAGNAALGIDLYFDFATENNKLRFFVSGEMNNIWGTKTFNNNLEIANESFTFGQASVGLTYDNFITFSFLLGVESSIDSFSNGRVNAGTQILKNN